MTKVKTSIIFYMLLIGTLADLNAQTISEQLKKLSDAPNQQSLHQPNTSDTISYETALKKWKTVSDVNNWIKINFYYSMDRAKQLAENSSTRERTSIYSPAELYLAKKGVCIDLSRFAVETINLIDTSKHAQFLMIEFEPINIDGSIIKKHWMTTYQDSSGYYFLADSKRPGYIAGPYNYADDFIAEYQIFRGRKIVSWKILPSYKKKKKGIQQKPA